MSELQFEEQAVEDKFQTFIQTLTDSETYLEFAEASEALDEDSEATALLREFDQKQEQMQQGEFDQSVMSELQDLKSEIADNDTIQRHREAREALVELLQGTNEIITEQIGRKFAQSTGGGCC
ncbi:YlbF family regulator [Haloarcula sp. Atlit-47R]|uniref:halo-CC-star protein HcsL n=1 Tax=Haloarcula sp. Atlit-47R TaxID=2282132 RepID=UPI000EF22BCE|nr:halo-CC-star protein HcsL [Haloarcula sp. Atlit-47R]RLM41326.1 YlbF family regulator [Haloarcula sp. Atlit-47R]